MKFFKKLVRFFGPLLYRLYFLYWYVFKPKTRGAKIILTHNREVILIKHTYKHDAYSLPGGGIKKKEQPEEAVVREVKEELGISIERPVYLGSFLSSGEHKKDTVFAYTAGLKSKEGIHIDNVEIDEVKWFTLDSLPPLGPITSKIFALHKEFTARREL